MSEKSSRIPKLVIDHTDWAHDTIDLSALSQGQTQGTLMLEFSAATDGILFSITGDHGGLELRLEGGRLDGQCHLGADRRWLDVEDAQGLDDGRPHAVALTADGTGLHVFVDGYEMFSATLLTWFDQMGATSCVVDPARIMEPVRLRVWNASLSAAAVAAASPSVQPFVQFAAAELSPRDARACGDLTEGAIRARFRTRGVGQQGVIVAAGGQKGFLELGVADGDLFYRVVVGKETIANVVAPGHFDSGNWHDLVLVSGRGAVKIYVDGYQLVHAPGAVFFADLGEIDRVTVGANLDGVRLFGEAQVAYVYDAVLSDSQVKRLAGVTPLPTRALFDTGYHGAVSYRIPSLLTLASGIVLAGADQRVSIANDSPNDINFVLRRSLDGGATWEDMQTLVSYPGEGRTGASATDAVLVQDTGTGRVLAVFDHFPGGFGQPNCLAGTGHDESGNRILMDAEGTRYAVQPDGAVLDAEGNPTSYRVDSQGNVFVGTQQRGNIYLAPGVDPDESLREYPTSYVQMIYSDDDGATWSDPVDITTQVKREWMRFLGTSPGNGIQLRHGSHAGRILVPVYYNHEGSTAFSSAALYSDDGGATWQLGQSPNDAREYNGVLLSSSQLYDDTASQYETVLVEGTDGRVHVYARNQHPSGRVAHAISDDGGLSWGDVDYVEQLTEIFSQPNAIGFDLPHSQGARVFANASQLLPFRGCGVVRVSLDDGVTWPHNRVFNPGHYVYQCMAQLPGGNLGLLWEREWQGLFFTELVPQWLTASKSTISSIKGHGDKQ